MGSHDGRIAVVTGGGRGIGQEYAVAPGLIHTEATMITVSEGRRAALLSQQAPITDNY